MLNKYTLTLALAMITGGSAFAEDDANSVSSAAEKIGGALGSAAVKALTDATTSGNNEIGGNVEIDTEVKVGKVDAVVLSTIRAGFTYMRDSKVTGNVKIRQRVTAGNLNASVGSSISLASVSVTESNMASLDANLEAKVGNVSASVLSEVQVANLSIHKTSIGGNVKMTSKVQAGDIKASIGSRVLLGSANL